MLLFELIKLLLHDPLEFVLVFGLLSIPLLITITIHEWSHGFVAYKFGDNTPKDAGRLSLNPFTHLDPMGVLMLFIVGIGWAKPVPINYNNIQSRWKFLLVAFAGPFSNFVMAVLFSVIFYLLITTNTGINENIIAPIIILLGIIVRVNLMLGIFNLIPVPPLDGANILRSLLPDNLSEAYFRIAPYGYFILLLFLFTGGINYISHLADFVQAYLLKFISHVFSPFLKTNFKV